MTRKKVKLKIKKGDEVEVTVGAHKGRKASVLEVLSSKFKIRVKGVNLKNQKDKKTGKLTPVEAPIDYSNVKLISVAKKAVPPKSKKK